VAIGPDGALDHAETARLRATATALHAATAATPAGEQPAATTTAPTDQEPTA